MDTTSLSQQLRRVHFVMNPEKKKGLKMTLFQNLTYTCFPCLINCSNNISLYYWSFLNIFDPTSFRIWLFIGRRSHSSDVQTKGMSGYGCKVAIQRSIVTHSMHTWPYQNAPLDTFFSAMWSRAQKTCHLPTEMIKWPKWQHPCVMSFFVLQIKQLLNFFYFSLRDGWLI